MVVLEASNGTDARPTPLPPAEQLVDEVVSVVIHQYGTFDAKT